jgi:hypothetical protein
VAARILLPGFFYILWGYEHSRPLARVLVSSQDMTRQDCTTQRKGEPRPLELEIRHNVRMSPNLLLNFTNL